MKATVRVIEVTRRATAATESGVAASVTLVGGEVGLLILDFNEDRGDFKPGEQLEITIDHVQTTTLDDAQMGEKV